MKIFTTLLALALMVFGTLDIINGAIVIGIICYVAAGIFGVARKRLP
jgi:hypothetical protein